MEKWEIHDDNGVIKSDSNQEEIQLIWDLTTRDLTDLASEYRSKYSRSTLKAKIADMAIDSWVGDLKLVQVHQIFR